MWSSVILLLEPLKELHQSLKKEKLKRKSCLKGSIKEAKAHSLVRPRSFQEITREQMKATSMMPQQPGKN
jgi:hypothetical protein